jgi:hypothetical protein
MLLKIVSPALALLLCSTTALQAGEQPQKWGTWLDGGAFYNNKDEARGESTLWVPFMQSPTSVFFGEARGKLFEESQLEGNFALGYRHMYGDGWNLGFWGGYDVRNTEAGSTFHQLAGGLEALSKNWDFRINGYVPLNDSNDLGSYSFSNGGAPTILLSGSNIMMQTGINSVTSTQIEYAMGGIDAEVGMRLPVEALKLDPAKLDLRVYAGAFYFDNDDAEKAIAGPKLRAELRFNDVISAAPGSRLTLETEYTSDDVRGDRLEAGARFRIPLDGGQSFASLNAQEQRMSEGLRRDTDVVSSTKSTSSTTNTLTTEAVDDAVTHVQLDKVAIVDGSVAGGVTTVSTAEGANTLIIAQGGSGNITNTAAGGHQILLADQTLVGGGGTIQLQGRTSGTVANFTAPGQQATLVNTDSFSVLYVNSNTHIAGLNIQGGGSAAGSLNYGIGVSSNGLQNISVSNNTFSNLGGQFATYFASNATQVSVRNNSFTGSNVGVGFGNGGTDITIDGNTFAHTQSAASFNDSNSGITINNNTVTDTNGANSFAFHDSNSDITISNNTITTASGMSFGNTNTQISMTGNTITGSLGSGGILLRNSNDGTIANNAFNSFVNGSAIYLSGSGNAFSGSGNSLTANNACGALTSGVNSGMTVQFSNNGVCP